MKGRITITSATLVIAIGMGLLGPTVRAAGGLTMTSFSPASGPVGTVVTISGTGFVANDIVRFNGTTAAVAGVNAAATVLTTSVPYGATSGIITVTDPTTGQTVGLPNSPFTVTRGVFPTPRSVWAGGSLTLFGSALSPDRTDPIGIGALTVGRVTTDRLGNFQIGVSVPWSFTSGQWQLWVVDPVFNKVITIIFVLGDWPEYRHDTSLSGYDTFESSLTPTSVAGLKQLWSKTTDPAASWAMEPSVADGLVYEGFNESGNGNFYAFTTDGKTIKWSVGLYAQQLGAAPAIANGVLYLVTGSSFGPVLYAMNAATGAPIWNRYIGSASGSALSAPAVVGTSVYIGTRDGNLLALKTSTGATEWSFAAGAAIDASPAVAGGIVYVASKNGILWAVNATTGKKVWVAYGAEGDGSAAVVGGVVYSGIVNGYVEALKASTGARLWINGFGGNAVFRTSPAVVKGIVYIGFDTTAAAGGILAAMNATSGVVNWTQIVGPGITDAAVADGVVYCASTTGNLVRAINTSTAAVLWHTSAVTAPNAPIISNGIVFLEGKNNIYAFSL